MFRIFSPLLRLGVVRAEDRCDETKEVKSRFLNPRLLFFGSSKDCIDEDELDEGPEEDDECQTQSTLCQECEKEKANDKENEKERDACQKGPSKLGCMFQGAKNGVREGALTGLFLGGAFGMYRYFIEGDNNRSGDEDSGTVNNVIFVSAINGGIAMAVISIIFCSARATFYCN